MKLTMTPGTVTLAAALATGSVMAQPANHAATTAPATGSVVDTANTAPNDRNPVLTQDGNARASKVIGSSVYNDHDDKVGSIDDLLVGGSLGIGTKYVKVPYWDLTFGDTQQDGDNRIVLKGATKESLKSEPACNRYRS